MEKFEILVFFGKIIAEILIVNIQVMVFWKTFQML